MYFTPLALALASLPFIVAKPRHSVRESDGDAVTTTYIGELKNVKMECHGDFKPWYRTDAGGYPNRCDAPCDTHCKDRGDAPVVDDCKVLADALLYENEKDEYFYIGPKPSNYVVVSYKNCSSTWVNQADTSVSYCRIDWAGVIGSVSHDCAPSAHGGICLANDQSKPWFIDVKRN